MNYEGREQGPRFLLETWWAREVRLEKRKVNLMSMLQVAFMIWLGSIDDHQGNAEMKHLAEPERR